MISSILSTALCVAAFVILWRTIGAMSSANIREFNGHPWRFAALSLHWALVAGGAFSVAAGAHELGGRMLVAGLALFILADRRRAHR